MGMNSAVLLVIDIQRGAFDGARCPPIDRATELVGNARALVDAARESGTPVVFVQHCDEPGQAFEEGTPHWDFHEELAPLPDDHVVKKYSSSAFENTDLGRRLLALSAKELVVCGLQSEFCVYNTSRSALELGYLVHLAQDAHGTWPSNGKSSGRICDDVNEELEAKGALLESTLGLAVRLRG
jgi:nicotinamidase-related amidase